GTSSAVSADHFTYTALSAPTVTAVSPTFGGSGGGTVVVVTGTGFSTATGVNFGGYAATSFTINSDTQLTAVAPPQAAATVDLTVTTPSGTSATGSADHYGYQAVPTLSSVSPSTDTATGGIPVTLTGTGFTGATAVYFGNVTATTFTVNSDTSITAIVPAQAAA